MLIKIKNSPQINRNSIYRRALNKMNKDYQNSIYMKRSDGVPLFLQRMSNDPVMNDEYRIEGEKRYYQRMLKKHITDFPNTLKQCEKMMMIVKLIGTHRNISHHMLAYRVSEYLF